MQTGVIIYGFWVLAHVIAGAGLCLLVLPAVIRLLRESGAEVSNYRKRNVVNMAGIAIVLVWIPLIAIAEMVVKAVAVAGAQLPSGFLIDTEIALSLTMLIIAAGFFGFIDDRLGTREFSGFKGHIGALFKGRLTTGAMKALGIPAVAIVASTPFSPGPFDLLGNAILISLAVNTLNLLDLRPGRALKIFIPLQLVLLLTAGSALATSSAALMGIAFVLLVPDLKEEIMLGDTGSNVLGAVLGFCLVAGFGWTAKLPVILILAFLQIITEKVSISAVIEKTPFLRSLDNLGRRAD